MKAELKSNITTMQENMKTIDARVEEASKNTSK
jgi:hypothetical protein